MCLVFLGELETVKENCPGLLTETGAQRAPVGTTNYVRIIPFFDVMKCIKCISLNVRKVFMSELPFAQAKHPIF